MKGSRLKAKHLKPKKDENLKVVKKYNFTNRLAKKERVKYFDNLDLNENVNRNI